jgi:hypothetical protein
MSIARQVVLYSLASITLAGVPILLRAQSAASSQSKWNMAAPPKSTFAKKTKAAPAPRRDLSGIWDATAEGGIQPKGPKEYPALMPGHPQDDIGGQPDESSIIKQLPYTALGLETLKTHKPGVGVRAALPADLNDPIDACDPVGYPRMQFFEFRVIQIAQMKNRLLYLNQFHNAWRVI